jgi:hypothetical protein
MTFHAKFFLAKLLGTEFLTQICITFSSHVDRCTSVWKKSGIPCTRATAAALSWWSSELTASTARCCSTVLLFYSLLRIVLRTIQKKKCEIEKSTGRTKVGKSGEWNINVSAVFIASNEPMNERKFLKAASNCKIYSFIYDILKGMKWDSEYIILFVSCSSETLQCVTAFWR